MFKFILVLLFISCTFGLSVLNHCASSVDNKSFLRGVKLSGKVYIIMTGALKAKRLIKITGNHKGRQSPFKIQLKCKEGTVKVTAKVGKKWKALGDGKVECKNDEMQIVINTKAKELWIGDATSPIKLKAAGASLTKSVSVSVSTNVKTLRISNGVCAAYPPSITTCDEARTYYTTHEQCIGGGVYKLGFYSCGDTPLCEEDGSYSLVQNFAANLYGCVNAAGVLLGDRFRINEISGDVQKHCVKQLSA